MMDGKKETYLYVCDGMKRDCAADHCSWNGTGECEYTQDRRHALYETHEFKTPIVTGGSIQYWEKKR